MADSHPTVRQRELGVRLRQLRTINETTVEEVAAELLCPATKITRIENGLRRASPRDVRDLCRVYRASERETNALVELARAASQGSWWTHYEDLRLSPYIGLEQSAASITAFSMYWVPALLQTEEYARAIITGIARKMDPAVLQQRLTARLKRQELLEQESPPHYRALLDEAVLHRKVGGPSVMSEQLEKILELAESKVTVQVVPFDVGAYASTDSNFEFLEFSGTLNPVVFVEGLYSNQYQEKAAEVERYREAIRYLRDEALTPHESLDFIANTRRVRFS